MPTTLVDRGWHVGLRVAYWALLVYWRVLRPRTFGVYVAVWNRGRLLLVQHSYKTGWATPAGRRRRRESPEAAARRELREEVGIDAADGALRPALQMISRTHGNEDHLDFFELELPGEPALALDGREVIRAAFATPAEALALDLLPPVREYLARRAAGAGDQSTDSTV